MELIQRASRLVKRRKSGLGDVDKKIQYILQKKIIKLAFPAGRRWVWFFFWQ
jgi:hypothetical protein